jgi:hypothetical protein
MDFDDLLEDSEPTGAHTLAKKKNWGDIASAKLVNALNDEDPFDDDDLWPVSMKKKSASKPSAAKTTYKAPSADDEDEWGVPTTKAKPSTYMTFQKNSARGSQKSNH